MNDLVSLVQIGITTRNRWDELRNTLVKINEFGLAGLRIVIFDDNSDMPCPYEVAALCARAELKRFDALCGYIALRNEMAKTLDSKYYLSLDDDSYPAAGSLEAAVAYAESLTDNFCLAFPIFNPLRGQFQLQSRSHEPYPVRAYIGCAHLLDRQRFLDMGGYREEFVHQGEEIEVSARAFQKGLRCRHFPGFKIDHLAASAARSFYRMDYYGSRNTLLWNDWFLPSPVKIVKQGRALGARLLYFLQTRRAGHIRGSLAGLKDIIRYHAFRHPMSRALYSEWQQLPPA